MSAGQENRLPAAIRQRNDVSAPVMDRPAASAGGEDAPAQLAALGADDMRACNGTINARMDSPVGLFPQLAAHIVAPGGKKLGPL